MMQKKILDQKIKELEIQEFVEKNLMGVGLSSTNLQVTPMAEKIIINTSRPGLVVGRKGQSIKKMTGLLKKRFNLENPQIEINEVMDVSLDPGIVGERIANTMERFGINRFKGVGHKAMDDAMNAGALGIEILISGKVPSQRAKRWRFYQGYLKKCGDLALTGVRTSYKTAFLKTGNVGIQVRIMPPGLKLLDKIKLNDEMVTKEGPVGGSSTAPEASAQEASGSDEENRNQSEPKKRPPKGRSPKRSPASPTSKGGPDGEKPAAKRTGKTMRATSKKKPAKEQPEEKSEEPMGEAESKEQ